MALNYDIWLVMLSLTAGSLAVYVTFGFIDHLYRTSTANNLPLLLIYSTAVGSGLWATHFINMLGFHTGGHFNFFSFPMLASWLASLIVGFAVCYITSKKSIPIKLLLIGGTLMGLGGYAMFYLGVSGFSQTVSLLDPATYIPVERMSFFVAIGVACVVAAITLISLSWVKDYSGANKRIIKIVFSLATSIAILAAHIAFNASVMIHTNSFFAATIAAHNDKKLLAIIVALGLICMFLLVFVVVIYYEKFGISAFKDGHLTRQKSTTSSEEGFKDALTKLPNRRAFQRELQTAAKRSVRASSTIALAYIDLDHFKPINDNFGHHVGDAVLLAVAQRLNAAVRACDSVARIGGDEFVALIEEIQSDEDLIPIIERVVQCIKEPFLVNNQQIYISCSVGVAVYPRDGDIEKLMICADAAMYKAKENGKNQFKFFDAEIELASDQMLEMQRDLRHAIENNEFSLVFQPKVNCKSQSLVGAEALIRWNHPTKGTILPAAFISAAERFGLINQINEWVIEEGCRAINRAKDAGITLKISINLARQQFRNPNLVSEVVQLRNRYKISADSLMFEIKETTAIKNEDQFKQLLRQFKAANIKVALDDFGSHQFSLSYLQNLNIDEIKLDKVFIAQINENQASRALVDAVIRLAHALDLNVVAEGVETEAQRLALVELGCNHMQGYLFSKPLSEEKLHKLYQYLTINFDATGEFLVSDYQKSVQSSGTHISYN